MEEKIKKTGFTPSCFGINAEISPELSSDKQFKYGHRWGQG